jgi:hypothetical protein
MSKHMTTVRYTGVCRECDREIAIRLPMATQQVSDGHGKHLRCANCRTINTVKKGEP